MKRFLLFFLLVACSYLGKAQVVLNEAYVDPGGGYNEYVELYNSSAALENLDNYTLLTYYTSGTGRNKISGFYVINFPNISLAIGQFSIAASALPFTYQKSNSTVSYTPTIRDFSWASMPSTGYVKQYEVVGTSTVYSPITTISNYNDLMKTLQNSGAQYVLMLYKNNVLVNALASGATAIPADLKSMPNLDVPSDGGATVAFTANFSGLLDVAFEYDVNGTGNNNGEFRTSDGKCGSWTKSASASLNTPGTSNGSSTSTSNTVITVGGSVNCTVVNGTRNANYFIVNSSTSATAYPLVLQVYEDNGLVKGQLDAFDKILGEQSINTAPASGTPNTVYSATLTNANNSIIVVAKSTAGCFQTIQAFGNTCATLPVTYTSFNAVRKNGVVALTWETASEENNKGFYIQRNTGGDWKDVAFVFSAAANGNSNSNLSYGYNDANASKGASQYRILQVDIDGKGRYSEIRSVRGLEQAARVVVFPNPSTDKINVLFEEAQSVRDITVTDIAGRVVKQYRNVTSNSLSIDNLKDGFYNIQVSDRHTGTTVTEKAVMKKR